MKLGEYLENWYKIYKYPITSKGNAHNRLKLIENHISAYPLGEKDLEDITTKDLQCQLNLLLRSGNKSTVQAKAKNGKPLSNRTVIAIRQLMIAGLNHAVLEGKIKRNPALRTSPIPIPQSNTPVFTPEHQRIFLQNKKSSRYYAAYVLYFFTGCRRGEILGLSWDNIDWHNDCIYIMQNLIIEINQIVLKRSTKTKKSTRAVPIPKEIKTLLREVKKRQDKEKKEIPNYSNPYNLIFTNKDGSWYNPNYFSRNFRNTCKKLGLPEHHLHCTRHSWATNMIQIGIPLTDVQHLGGWSRPDVLLEIYSHTVQKTHKKAINKLYKYIMEEEK